MYDTSELKKKKIMHLDLKISTGRVLNLEAMGKFSMGTDNTQLNYVVHKCEIGFSKVVTQNKNQYFPSI